MKVLATKDHNPHTQTEKKWKNTTIDKAAERKVFFLLTIMMLLAGIIFKIIEI